MINKRKNQLLFLGALLVIALVIYLVGTPRIISVQEVTKRVFDSATSPHTPVAPKAPVMKNGRKIMGLTPGQEEAEARALVVNNSPSPEWKASLRKAVYRQGGSSLKRVDILPVESLIWVQDGIALNVESVVVRLQDHKKSKTEFRAMVDSQSGKILQTWDQPIVDEFQKNPESGIRLDPRYTEENP